MCRPWWVVEDGQEAGKQKMDSAAMWTAGPTEGKSQVIVLASHWQAEQCEADAGGCVTEGCRRVA